MAEVRTRILTRDGISRFAFLLEELKSSPELAEWGKPLEEKIDSLLYDNDYTEDYLKEIKIDPERKFENRYEFGRYLDELFGEEPFENEGLLSWLALLYLDQVCEKKGKKNRLKIGAQYRYIPELNNNRRFYRHLVLTPLLAWKRMGENCDFFLMIPLHVGSHAVENTLGRQDIISNKNVINLMRHLYFDKDKEKIKTKAFDHKAPLPGNAIRLMQHVIPQLSMNYDMYVMPEDRLIQILPSEFESWIEKAASLRN